MLLALALGLLEIFSVLGEGERKDRFSFQVLFKDVQGLRRGSRVVYRGMEAGTVGKMVLAGGGNRISVTIHLRKDMASLARTTAQLWVVRPRLAFLSHQLSGLDTLIKESYVRLRVGKGGRPLEEGETLLGLEVPPPGLSGEDLEDPRRGDLVGRVLFPRNHGLGPGSPVLFRGMPVGKVRRVTLVDQGKGVLVVFQVPRAFRETVRSGSRFWISRPTLRGNILTGISVEDLGSIFSPALSYDSPPPGTSGPAPDKALFYGLDVLPSRKERWDARAIDPGRTAAPAGNLLPAPGRLSPWVQVVYRAKDKDWIGPDDPIEGDGEGVLYQGKDGAFFVLTGRSASDGTWLMKSHWYDRLKIVQERIRVVLGDGRILDARRAWLAEDKDLALLRLVPPGGKFQASLPPWDKYLSFLEWKKEKKKDSPGRIPWNGPVLLKEGGKARGILGMARCRPEIREVVPFSLVPTRFRPGKK